jgi:cystathionine beta-lyase/cystathionine gamma-synthase
MQFATKASRAGQAPPSTGSVVVPIHQTVNCVLPGVERPSACERSRSADPTRPAVEACLSDGVRDMEDLPADPEMAVEAV